MNTSVDGGDPTNPGKPLSKRALRRQAWAKRAYLARQAANHGEVLTEDTGGVQLHRAGDKVTRKRGRARRDEGYGDEYDGAGDDGDGYHYPEPGTEHGGTQHGKKSNERVHSDSKEGDAAKPTPRGYKLGLKGEPALGAMHPSWRVRRVAGARQYAVMAPALAQPCNRKERRLVARRGVCMSHSKLYLAFDEDGNVDPVRSVTVNKKALAFEARMQAKLKARMEREKARKVAGGKRALRKRRRLLMMAAQEDGSSAVDGSTSVGDGDGTDEQHVV